MSARDESEAAPVAAEQLRALRDALRAARDGNFDARLPVPASGGLAAELAVAFNELADSFGREVRNLVEVTLAVARGDLSREMRVETQGELRELNTTINAMLAQLRVLGAEVSRVARAVASARGGEGAPSGAMPGTAGVWKDLTENLTVAEKLALVTRARTELLANVSHELRTPLNSLLVLAKLLADNAEANLTARQLEYAQTIQASGGDLLTLLNDILEMSRVEAGKVRVAPRTVAVAGIVTFIDRMFRPVAEQKGVAFETEIAPDVPAQIHTDPLRLQQILKNLLSNAFKFTARGCVALRVSVADAGPRIAFAVHDTGVGIALEKQRQIFDAFEQAEATTFEQYGGTGLGLSISRDLARLLGGELSVASEPGRGSTFTLVLPADGVARAPTPEPAAAAPRPALAVAPHGELRADGSLAGRAVLVVDDEMRSVFALASVVESAGARVEFAESGAQALEFLRGSGRLDLVLMDVEMPGMDGLATTRSLRALAHRVAVPVIAITTRRAADEVERCRAAGASACLVKPVDAEQLVATILEVLGH